MKITLFGTLQSLFKACITACGFISEPVAGNVSTVPKGIPSKVMNTFGVLKEEIVPDSLQVFYGPVDFAILDFKDNSEELKKLGAFTVSLSINLEPVYTIILAIFILKEHEQLGTNFYIGSVLIIMTVIANGIIKNQQKKRR